MNWEWLIQQDGPSWEAPEWLRDDSRVAIESNGDRQGVSITRNRALGRAQGRFVLNLDADDFLLPDALAVLARRFTDDPRIAFAVPDVVIGCIDGGSRPATRHIATGLLPPGAVERFWRASLKMPFHAAAALWDRDVLLAYGGWPAMQVGEDSGLLLAVAASRYGWYEGHSLFFRREHPESIMQTEEYWQVHRPRDNRFNQQRLEAIRTLKADEARLIIAGAQEDC